MVRDVADSTTVPRGWRTRQPGIALWTLISSVVILFRCLLASIVYVVPCWRPVRQWTYAQSVLGMLVKQASVTLTQLGVADSVRLDGAKLGSRWMVIAPADVDNYRGPFASETVKPQSIGATWYPHAPTLEEQGQANIVLWFHSGSFIYLSGRPSDSAMPAKLLNTSLGPNTFLLWVQYRLAGCKKRPTIFPGPMQDALTSYLYLVCDLCISPERIILGGDSSGATMAIGLIRYLHTYQGVVKLPPTPRACLLLSPSVDYCFEGDQTDLSMNRNVKTDYLDVRMLAWGICVFNPPPLPLNTPYLSPARYPFASPVPFFVQAGGAEILCDSVRQFVKAMQTIPGGNRVEFLELPYAPHDVFAIGKLAGWGKQAEEVCQAAAAFIDRLG